MCSVDPDTIGEMTRITDTLDISRGDVMCRKCIKTPAEVVLRVKDAYCRSCFLIYFVHKFRSTIGKSKQIFPRDRVLVGFSGGASSTALLLLIKEGLQEDSHKKLRFDPVFLFVDECVLGGVIEEGCEYMQKVVKEVTSLGFPCYVASLEQAMAPQPLPPCTLTEEWKKLKHPVNTDLRKKFCDIFNSCKSASTQQDLHDQFLQTVLRQCAHSLGFEKLFLADNATTLSIRILSQVAMGRGSQLPTRVHFKAVCDMIEVYRPMRELLEKEILHYLDLHGIKVPKPPTFDHSSPSIASCTENFVRGLQKDFPATMTTIFRTGDKLVGANDEVHKERDPDIVSNRTEDLCALCASKLDTDKGEASALHATIVSQKYSKQRFQETLKQRTEEINPDSFDQCAKDSNDIVMLGDPGGEFCDCATGGGGCAKREKSVQQSWEIAKSVDQHLCYGCRITLRNLSDLQLLPARVKATVTEQRQRRTMKEQIKDFLL